MKKIISMLLCLLITVNIIGCTSQKVSQKSYSNKIYSTELTEDEKNIINLIGIASDIDIYKYEIDDTYETISIWIETYKNGELISNPSRMNSRIDLKEGRIAIIVDRDSNYKWRISHQNSSSLSTHSFQTKNDFETDGRFSVGGGELNESVEIIPEKEIVLEKFLFEDGNTMSIYSNQYYVENPEALKQYDYAYLIKCKFSRKNINEIDIEER